MYPVHDVDAILLLSLALAAKRRPADLNEIFTAIGLMQDMLPTPNKLSDAFARLSAHGLIVEIDGGYTLTEDSQKMMTSQRKNDDTQKKIYRLKEHLADHLLEGDHNNILIHPDQLRKAIDAYKKGRQTSGRSWLIDKPKPVWISKKDLVRGAKLPHSRRK